MENLKKIIDMDMNKLDMKSAAEIIAEEHELRIFLDKQLRKSKKIRNEVAKQLENKFI